MSLQYYINDVLINSDDVIDTPATEEQITIGDQKLIASTLDLELDNINRDYDDRYAGSLFFGVQWYHKEVQIYDTELSAFVWIGRITNMEVNEAKKTTKVYTANVIEELAQKTCICNYSGVSPAQAIRDIILNVANIPETFVQLSGFNQAIAYQEANAMTIDVVVDEEMNKKCIDVINELHRVSLFHLYSNNNIIEGWQWTPWAGQGGQRISADNYINGSYKHKFDAKQIFNQYSIAYNNGGTVSTVTSSLPGSVATYGTRSFVVPKDKNDSPSPSDYPVLYDNSAGATFAGNLVLSRWGYVKKIAEFTLDDYMEPVQLNTQLDLDFEPFVKEPVRVTYKKHDKKKNQIKIKAEFMNTPHMYFTRDTTRPSPVEIARVVQDGSTSAMVFWTLDSGAVGYKVYFTTIQGAWEQEMSRQGVSPVTVVSPETSVDGYAVYRLSGLQPGAKLYFSVRTYNDILIESLDSNIAQLQLVSTGFEFINGYMVAGSEYDGITLDPTNPMGGMLPSGYTHYDELNYDAGTYEVGAVYESKLFQKGTDHSSCKIQVNTPNSLISLSYRTYDNGSFSAWVPVATVNGMNEFDPGASAFQWRAVWDGGLWSDPDSVTLLEVA